MRLGLVHNEDAGDARRPSDLAALLRRFGHHVHRLAHPSDGVGHWLDAPLDLVVAAGGDGTIAATMCALIETPLALPLAILPMGTANNIASSLGIVGDMEAAIRDWASHRVRRFDIGVASGPWGERCFAESVGGGVVTHGMVVMDRSHGHSPTSTAKLARARAAHADVLQQLRPARWRIALDGHVVDDDFLALEVLNIAAVGPGLWLAPASPFDGQFTVVGIQAQHRGPWIDRLRFGSAPVPRPRVWRAREVVVHEADRLHVDDTVLDAPAGAAPVRLSLRAGGVPVLSPSWER